MPVTIPDELTEAIVLSLLLHVPPDADSVKETDASWQTVAVPLITPAVGVGVTFTFAVATAVPQLLVTE